MRTKKAALPILLVCAVSFTALPATWAREKKEDQDPQRLYQQCQERLKENPDEEARKLCDEGMKLHQQGKQEEAIKTLNKGLKKIGG